MPRPSGSSLNNRKPNLTNNQRQAILQFLLMHTKPGSADELQHGTINTAASQFQVTRATISNLWKRAKSSKNNGDICMIVDSRKAGNVGRKKIDYSNRIQAMKDVPLEDRQNIRTLSYAINVPATTLWRRMKDGSLKRHSNAVKPWLTDQNKLDRLLFSYSHLELSGHFSDMYDVIHIDEKWFYMKKVNNTYYLLPDEEIPHETSKSKRYIDKVMFMCAVARPRGDFDGKIGIWPYVYQKPAERNSKNRPKGTIETKPIESINADVNTSMMLDNVLPAIAEKFPIRRGGSYRVQQDNAKPHSVVGDRKFNDSAREMGLNIVIDRQPANSPDFNILDLGFFAAIQSLQHRKRPKTIDHLIQCVQEAFEEQPYENLNAVFLSLHQAMESAMSVDGCNRYKLQHMGKKKLQRQGELPTSVLCKREIIEKTRNTLLDLGLI